MKNEWTWLAGWLRGELAVIVQKKMWSKKPPFNCCNSLGNTKEFLRRKSKKKTLKLKRGKGKHNVVEKNAKEGPAQEDHLPASCGRWCIFF